MLALSRILHSVVFKDHYLGNDLGAVSSLLKLDTLINLDHLGFFSKFTLAACLI